MLLTKDFSSSSCFFSGTDEELAAVEQAAEKLHELGGFKLDVMSGSLSKKIYSKFTKNIRMIRGCFLMEMMHAQSGHVFESVPSIPSVFQSINKNPEKAISKYPAMFIQNFTFQITTAYDKPLDFARAVANYFKQDDSQYNLFCYSTFPAIYSYFLGQEFCSSASLFLIAFMVDSKRRLITESLLSSFFKAVPTFYTRLWSLLSDKMSNFGLSPSFQKLYSAFEECLTKSLCHVTEYHINAFASFAQTYPNNVIDFLIDKLLVSQFVLAADASQFLPHRKHNEEYMKFFNELKKPENKKKAMHLVNIIREHKGFLDVIPSMSGTVWSRGIPFLISDSDVMLLSDIFQLSTSFKLIVPQDVVFSKSYDVVLMEIFPSYCKEDQEDVCKDLFGEKPDDVYYSDNIMYSKYWRCLNLQAKQDCQDAFTFIRDQKNREKYVRLQKKDFMLYCYKRILDDYNKNYCQLETNVLLVEHESRLQDLKNSIDCYSHMLLHKYTASFLKKSIARERGTIMQKISKSISKVIGDETVSCKIQFEIVCAALDQINITVSSFPEGKKFLSLLNKWTENVWPTTKNHDLINSRMVHILNTASTVSHIGELKFGKRLIILIEFVRSLSQILGDSIDNNWIPLMHLALMTADTEDVLTTFLFFYHYVFAETKLVQQWGRVTLSLWNMLTVGMWDILKGDQELFIKCSDETKMKAIFKISTITIFGL